MDLLRPLLDRFCPVSPSHPSGSLFEPLEGRRLLSAAASDGTLPAIVGNPNPELASPLYDRDPFRVKINFQPDESPTVPDYYRTDLARPYGQRGNGLYYGWDRDLQEQVHDVESPNTPTSADGSTNELFDTFVEVPDGAVWEMAVPNGTYLVSLVAGDPDFQDGDSSRYGFSVEGTPVLGGFPLEDYPWVEGMEYVTVADERLTVTTMAPSENNKLMFLSLAKVEPPPTYSEGQDINWETTTDLVSPVARAEPGIANVGDRIFVMGGYSPDYLGVTRRVDILDTQTMTWTSGPELPGTETHAAVAYDEAGGYIYWLSGQVGAGDADRDDPSTGFSTTSTLESWRLNVQTLEWEQFVDVPAYRFAAGASVIDGQLHYFGGANAGRVDASDTHWSVDIAEAEALLASGAEPREGLSLWEERAALPRRADHFAVSNLDADGDGRQDEFLIIGGEHGHGVGYVAHDNVFAYDPQTDEWSERATMPKAVSHAESIVEHDGRIWMFGGQNQALRYSSDVFSYDPMTDVWQTHSQMPETRKGGIAIFANDRFYYLTGDRDGILLPPNTLVGELI